MRDFLAVIRAYAVCAAPGLLVGGVVGGIASIWLPWWAGAVACASCGVASACILPRYVFRVQ